MVACVPGRGRAGPAAADRLGAAERGPGPRPRADWAAANDASRARGLAGREVARGAARRARGELQVVVGRVEWAWVVRVGALDGPCSPALAVGSQVRRAPVRALSTANRFPSYILNAPATEVTVLNNGVRVASEVRARLLAGARGRGGTGGEGRLDRAPAIGLVAAAHHDGCSPRPRRAATARRPRWACTLTPAAATRPRRTTAWRTSSSTSASRCVGARARRPRPGAVRGSASPRGLAVSREAVLGV